MIKGIGKPTLSMNGLWAGAIRGIWLFLPWAIFTAPGLLESDGLHLSNKGKRIVAHESAGWIERALN